MKPVKLKKKPQVGDESEESLCCCEYINQNGERSHIVGCLCDCEDVDQACDRWITCKAIQPEVFARAIETLSDRLRVPWIRGAKKVDVSVIPPLILLPISLHIAALHALLAVVILTSLPVLVVWYYQLTHRRKGKTLLFLSLALFSLGYMYYVFVQEVLPRGHIGWGHFIAISCGLLMTLLFLAKAKQNPGYLTKSTKMKSEGACASANGAWTDGVRATHGGVCRLNGEKGCISLEKNCCKICQVVRPPRSGHCRICGACVQRLDHHCVWINNCIGAQNHKSFILALSCFLLTSTYGIVMTLGTVCRGQNVVTALLYCPGVYREYSTALAYTCVWYSTIVTAGIGYILLTQLLNISYNITEREACIALREKMGRCYLGGLVVDTGTFNQGFFKNWVHFLSLESQDVQHSLADIV
ncbi:palmitoyltransferase ZDHHC23 [Bombina bombina]|uniref:palmitoyltransferase ZDHHC23 n=1 Tax=Bombina bombina TaxID=8345 RepID=UPI00235AE3E3|nr:palmitoyltransferase ZDHHC23 [Bombina bombina]